MFNAGFALKEENCQVLRAKPDSLCVIFGGMLCLNYFGISLSRLVPLKIGWNAIIDLLFVGKIFG
ncbi:MAG: hypothetical protein D8M51_04755 [Ignavibacteriae bacterium]|nr:hypothetical protein [Ignavibacteriota bacterium]GIK21123.1 MAG: hypothetical protein BroJett005_05370 [Ignavibacteriota bacterium]